MKRTKKEQPASSAVLTAVTRPRELRVPAHGLSGAECSLYDQLRASVPVIDAAVRKIVRLIGGCRVTCPDRTAERALNDFFTSVPVGCGGQGLNAFLARYADSLITYGTAVGEIVTGNRSGTVRGLYNADPRDLELTEQAGGMGVGVRLAGSAEPPKHPELILVSALDPNPAHPLGNSLLAGLPFVSDILLNIFSCIGTNFERLGNLRFAVTYKPGEGGLDGAFAADRAAEIAREWSAAMSDTASVRDFVAVGDVSIKVIGADNPMLDTEIPVRQMLEQIVAKLGLPPFLLGFAWSTTERMSAQQTDLLTTELWHYRGILEPVVARIGREYLKREGLSTDLTVTWDEISLQDEVETARARLYTAQADALTGASEPKGEEA